MSVSVRNTDILLNDSTVLSTGIPVQGAVGSYAFMSFTTNTTYGPGYTAAGSALRFRAAQAGGPGFGSGNSVDTAEGSSASGTWKAMGFVSAVYEYYGVYANNHNTCTLWVRIS